MNHSASEDLKLRGAFMGKDRASALFKKYIALVVLLLLILISSTISDAFFTQKNLSNLLRQLSGTTIVSMGMLLVILTGGIDLSVGSVVALSGVLFAYFATFTSLPVALLLTFFFAALCGMVSGYFSSFQNMAPFVVTLAMMSAAHRLYRFEGHADPDSEPGGFYFWPGLPVFDPVPGDHGAAGVCGDRVFAPVHQLWAVCAGDWQQRNGGAPLRHSGELL